MSIGVKYPGGSLYDYAVRTDWGLAHVGFNQTEIYEPSKAMCMADGTDWQLASNYANALIEIADVSNPPITAISYRHTDNTNAMFFDGHVSSLPYSVIFDPSDPEGDGLSVNASFWDPLSKY